MLKKGVTWASRIIFGAAFIFAGFTKAIDPWGGAYKLEDYFLSFGLEELIPIALPAAILLHTLEFVVGFAILLGLKMRYSAWAGLIFMAFFTPLTLYIAITDPVPHCGCFGDAWVITNWETFYKNIILLAAAIIIFKRKDKIPPLWSPKKDWWGVGGITILVIGLSVYCIRNLPIMDFRPWKVGNDVTEFMQPTEEEAKTYLIFENKETGEQREYPADDYPWDDPEWSEKWEFVKQRKEIIQPYEEAEISDFFVMNESGEDVTGKFTKNPDYQFLVIAPDLRNTNIDAFTDKINELALKAQKDDYDFAALTGSSFDYVNRFLDQHEPSYEFYQSDPIELKTIIRSNPGLVLMKDGVVLGKWHYRNIPAYSEIKNDIIRE